MRFTIPVQWKVYGEIEVEAGNLKEARQNFVAYDLPDGANYVDDSLEINEDVFQEIYYCETNTKKHEMFQVFQDNAHAGFGWDASIFNNFDDAVIYAHKWAYPIFTGVTHKMELDVPVDMSMCGVPVMMTIKEYGDELTHY